MVNALRYYIIKSVILPVAKGTILSKFCVTTGCQKDSTLKVEAAPLSSPAFCSIPRLVLCGKPRSITVVYHSWWHCVGRRFPSAQGAAAWPGAQEPLQRARPCSPAHFPQCAQDTHRRARSAIPTEPHTQPVSVGLAIAICGQSSIIEGTVEATR